jgi:hypothetical protein
VGRVCQKFGHRVPGPHVGNPGFDEVNPTRTSFSTLTCRTSDHALSKVISKVLDADRHNCGVDNGGCASYGWSIITSSSTNSQLAGVLAGFVFSGIIILFALQGQRYTHALGLFCATLAVLGFDSYLFSVITGMNQDPYCARVWSIGIAASGMLAVGAAGLTSAVCWLLAAHVDSESPQGVAEHQPMLINLNNVARLMTHGVAVALALQLARTASEYLGAVFEDRAKWVVWSTLVVPGVVSATALVLAATRARRSRGSDRKSDRLQPSVAAHGESLRLATYGSLAYGVFTPIFAGVMTSLPPSWWEHRSAALIAITAFVNLIVPGVLLVAHVLAAPSIRLKSASSYGGGSTTNGSPDRKVATEGEAAAPTPLPRTVPPAPPPTAPLPQPDL